MQSLGINIGSTSLKLVLLDDNKLVWSGSLPHEGDFATTAKKLLLDNKVPEGISAFVTGNEGRLIFNIPGTYEPLCIEAAIKNLNLDVDAVVCMGGEDLIVYSLSEGKIINNFSGSKCSSGTGEFLKQQLSRMNMTLEDIAKVPDTANVYQLSTRCSVFMKSDCTHKLNKQEATKDDITLSLCNVMAVKVIDFLKRAKIFSGRVILTGGITLNRHIIRFIKEKAPKIDFIIPDISPIFEAYGAALLATSFGSPLPPIEKLIKNKEIKFDSLSALSNWYSKIKTFDIPTQNENSVDLNSSNNNKYILGVDGGSTTTKACLIDADTDVILASHYARTHGDPVRATKECLFNIQTQVIEKKGNKDINIIQIATTGSSREILGVFLQTNAVYNEIIAHSIGTTYFDPEVETIFEIGGQDAKYVLLRNGVPIDYAMNEACSAGTGSFIEESASGDLSIHEITEIGPIALKAEAPIKFGEHCSAFINSDIRKAVQQGASRENITAGIICSIVANYLNRVVGNRTIGGKIFLQGGVAKNPAVPLAFAMMLNREILIPPLPELMGCFGVALLAKKKSSELNASNWNIDELLNREIIYESIFTCKSCENLCPIQVLKVNNQKYMFGGRCNKYANMRKSIQDIPVFDYIEKRQKLLFDRENNYPDQDKQITIGFPRALSIHTLYPLYYHYFRELGIKTYLSENIVQEGLARTEAEYCFPAEIAHGMVQDCLNKGVDFIFLPHFRDMQSYEDDVHANFCPITQALPYYVEKAFPEVEKNKWLPCVVSFKFGNEKALELFQVMNQKLEVSEENSRNAFFKALEKQNEFFQYSRKLGKEALIEVQKSERPVIAILGRPYNAFTAEANMGIPRKFTTRGYSVLPFDILPFENEEIFPNMYWYYGQQVVKAATFIKNQDNIFLTYITNFSCAPDSFILHYIKWIMGAKPFLILELDNHSADAGIDTRVEAFLDIINSSIINQKSVLDYQLPKIKNTSSRYENGWKFVFDKTALKENKLRVDNHLTGEKINIRYNKKVKVLLSNMGAITTEYLGAALRSQGINTEVLPIATNKTIQIARNHSSGKECVPNHLVLGSALEFIWSDKYRKDEIYLLFVPITVGPCRTGQYYVFYENLFRDLMLENLVVFILSAENSYTELDNNFAKQLWKGLVICDYLKDIQNSLLTTAVNPQIALIDFEKLWKRLIHTVEHKQSFLWKELKLIANEVKKIPLKKKVTECPKVLVVGEIYVRRDDYAVSELVNLMSERGIIVKIAGVSEWIHYLDFVREYALKKLINLKKRPVRLHNGGLIEDLQGGGEEDVLKPRNTHPQKKDIFSLFPFFSRPFYDLKKLHLEMWWKKSIEKKVISILAPTGLVPETEHNMRVIMKYTEDYFLNLELNSEIAVSAGSAAAVMESGYSGIVNIAPFACLIGRVIEGIYTPWARERNYPILSVEVDGNQLPPNIVNKLNIFMVNVLRFKSEDDLSSLIDKDLPL
ncbi:MAG: acyl-CoA dehydratase activase [Candidatus Cloacimonetes bacterium]|nr:acyl-CoA dehydratase activase [Candidatus Cloacimonadota bacterium]